MAATILKVHVFLVSLISLGGLVYVYLFPPPSMFVTREGVSHLAPQVVHPETGEAIELGELIRHYRGD